MYPTKDCPRCGTKMSISPCLFRPNSFLAQCPKCIHAIVIPGLDLKDQDAVKAEREATDV